MNEEPKQLSTVRNLSIQDVANRMEMSYDSARALMRLGADKGGIACSDVSGRRAAAGKRTRQILKASEQDIADWYKAREVRHFDQPKRTRLKKKEKTLNPATGEWE